MLLLIGQGLDVIVKHEKYATIFINNLNIHIIYTYH